MIMINVQLLSSFLCFETIDGEESSEFIIGRRDNINS
jgi:hypothetical protein